MNPSTKAATGFLKSLALLIAALGLFYLVVIVPGGDPPVAPVEDDIASSIAATRRAAMRQSSASAADAVRRVVEERVYKEPGPAVPVRKEGPKIAAAKPEPNAGKFDPIPEVAPIEGVDPDVQKAIDLIDGGQIPEAVAKLEEILKRDPKNEQALVELAMIHLLDLKQSDRAIDYLERVVSVNPGNRIVMSELVSLYEEEGRTDEGLAYMMQMHDQNPDAPALSYGIGQMLASMGRDGEAIPYLEKAAQNPENPVRAYRDLAEAYSRSGDSDRAVDAYKKAIDRQEQEVAEKTERGLPVTFAEERLNFMKMDMARELIERGDREAAEKILDEIETAMPGDDAVHALRSQIKPKG